jgi:rhamnose utilization protein RhaD (predicted bifunctional aldolase and dehydrogenase)
MHAAKEVLMNARLKELLELSHELGREDRQLTILGEGNTSAKLDGDQFVVKASGSCLATLTEADLTVCDGPALLSLLDKKTVTDDELTQALLQSRAGGRGKKPSIEAVFHAWLLTLPSVGFVGHTHSLAANQILCSPRARDFAERRLFPDEVVCCGPASVFVPYADPGLVLAREIRDRTNIFVQQHGIPPRLILLQNHGIIALGGSGKAVIACTLMAAKAAAIFMGAAALGGPNFLTQQHVDRIAARPDEAYRQKELQL